MRTTISHALKKYLAVLAILGSFYAVHVPTASASDLFPEIAPAPEYEPDEVVGIQMRALGTNNLLYDCLLYTSDAADD